MIEILTKNTIVDFGSNNLKISQGLLSGDKVGYLMIQDSAGIQTSMLFDNKEAIFNLVDILRDLTRTMDRANGKDE